MQYPAAFLAQALLNCRYNLRPKAKIAACYPEKHAVNREESTRRAYMLSFAKAEKITISFTKIIFHTSFSFQLILFAFHRPQLTPQPSAFGVQILPLTMRLSPSSLNFTFIIKFS